MAIFYLGNPLEKRKKLLTARSGVYIDNDEVVASYQKGNKYCFIVAKRRFSNFSVWEFLSYSKSLEHRRPLRLDEANDMVSAIGYPLSVKKKLRRLNQIELVAVKLALALRHDSACIAINFDGIRFSKSTRRRMHRLLLCLSDYQLIVAVSDIRFVPKDGAVEWFAPSKPQKATAKIIKEGKLAARLT